MARMIFHGQSCCEFITDDDTRLLVDPFLTGSPVADVGADHFTDRLDYLLLTHGHGDHIGAHEDGADAWDILKATGAQLIATYELTSYAGDVQGIQNAHPMHIGGGYDFPFGRVKFTTATHGGMINSPGAEGYTTNPVGIVMTLDGVRVYNAGDTGLTMDMALLKGEVDVAIVPIGDNFTMGPEDAARAIEMIEPKVAIPVHHGTWDLIAVDPQRFVDAVGAIAEVKLVSPGDEIAL